MPGTHRFSHLAISSAFGYRRRGGLKSRPCFNISLLAVLRVNVLGLRPSLFLPCASCRPRIAKPLPAVACRGSPRG